MAMLLDTPSRVLRRVQEYEEMELPSLPSFTHDLDDDDNEESEDPYYGDGGVTTEWTENKTQDDLSTPHVARYRSPPRTGSTIVPRMRTPPSEPTPLAHRNPRTSPSGYTSTPCEEQLRLSSRSLSRSTDSRQSRQPSYSSYPSEASTSQRLPPPDLDDLPEPSLGSESPETSAMDTPIPPTVVKRASPAQSSQPSGPDSRIPSLSRSEVSGTDNEATTPEGPTRYLEHMDEPTHDYATHEYTTHDYTTHDYTTNITVTNTSLPKDEQPSPRRSEATPSAIRMMDMPGTAARAAATPFSTHMAALRDITPAYRNRERESTPSPGGALTPASEYATPKAGSDAADRRKSHLLTVLATSKIPSRFKARGTPHPARRVSLAPESSSILEEGNSVGMSTLDNSFISIASSQDLTMDRRGSRAHTTHRGNTSVPNIVLGTGTAASPAGAENRAEFVKIGKHTNMMNNALHEENNRLAQEVQDWQNEYAWLNDVLKAKGIEVTDDGDVVLPAGLNASTSSSKSGSSSAGRQARLDELEETIRHKDEAITALEMELAASDKADAIAALKKERDDAITARETLETDFAKKTQAHAAQFAEICEDYDRDLAKLRAELASATTTAAEQSTLFQSRDSEVADLKDEVASFKKQLASLETELDAANRETHAKAEELREANTHLDDLEQDNKDLLDQLEAARAEATRLHQEIEEAHKDDDDSLAALKHRLTEAEIGKEDAEAALASSVARVAELQDLMSAKDEEITTQRKTIQDLQLQADVRSEDEAALRVKVADLETDLRKTQTTMAQKDADIASLHDKLAVAELEADKTVDIGNNSVVQTLQERLEDAHREIGRLKGELGALPARELAIAQRDARIKSLETEKLALQERVRQKELATPARRGSSMSATPLVNRVLANLRTPATPGPLKELSWLQTTIGDSNESILRAQLDHLQQELDVANTQLDRNFNRLEEAGLGSVALAERLAHAHDRIAALEDQLRELAKENKTSLASLDLDRHKNERLENALDAVHAQMAELKADMRAEKERMQDEARRLRVALKDLQDKADEEVEDLGVEIARTRREADERVADAEEQLQALRADKDGLNTNLRAARVTIERLETDIRELQRSRDEKAREQRRGQDQNASAAARQQETITTLQSKLHDAKADADTLRDTLRERGRALETAERHIADLKAERERTLTELAAFGADLSAKRRECTRFGTELEALRVNSETAEVRARNEVDQLTSDLRWTKEQLESTSRQAKAAEREYAEVEARALEAERRVADAERRAIGANHRAADAERKVVAAQAKGASAAEAASAAAAAAAVETRAKYKAQTRKLAAQIEYLKALYARENTFRHALALQKKFFVLMLGGYSLNEQATLRAIASMGFPAPPPPKRPARSLKSVAIAVVATVRARRVAERWRAQSESRVAGTRR